MMLTINDKTTVTSSAALSPASGIEDTLKELRNKHQQWQSQKRIAESTLYVLMKGCLEFYHFLKEDKANEEAFKKLCTFKWGRKTKLETIIAKAVFGADNKQHYAYAKALSKAVENNVGTTGEISMPDWLSNNGGVNGVIRKKTDDMDAETTKDFGRYIAEKKINCQELAAPKRIKFIMKSKDVCKSVDDAQRTDCFIYAFVDRSGDDVKVHNLVLDGEVVSKMLELLYKHYGSDEELKSKFFQEYTEVKERLSQLDKERTDKVARKLQQISQNVSTAA